MSRAPKCPRCTVAMDEGCVIAFGCGRCGLLESYALEA
jgi:hypothetical protein